MWLVAVLLAAFAWTTYEFVITDGPKCERLAATLLATAAASICVGSIVYACVEFLSALLGAQL